MRRLVLLPALLAILVCAPPALAWTWPVDGPVLQPFVLGGDPYAAGQHRGIDVGSAEGAPVRAPAAGTITFAGTVPAGGRTVTIQTPDGFAVTLLHLGAVHVAEGDAVAEGAEVGVLGWSGDPEHTVPSVHLGVRIAAQPAGYVDPLSLLPPPGPIDVVAEEPDEPEELDEPAAIPAVGVEDDQATAPVAGDEGDEATAPVVEVTTLPSQPAEAGAAPENLPQVAQSDPAEPADADVTLLEPLVVVAVESAEPPAASAAPAVAATPEPSGAQPHTALVTGAAEAPSPVTTSSAGDPTGPVKAATLVPASVPANQPDARRDVRRPRAADRLEPAGRPHRARIDRRAEPIVEARLAAARRGAGSVERETRRLSHSVWQPEEGAAPVPASSGGAWFWRVGLATILAVLAFVLLMRRSGRGGQGTAGREVPPSTPARGAAQGAEPGVGVEIATPAPRRDARALVSRPGRRLDRGGPGGPAKRPAGGLRGRRASV